MALMFVAVDFDLSWADTEETTGQSIVNIVAEEVEKEMEFLYIENRQLESPGTQNIAVAWEQDMNNITEFTLVYSDNDNNTYEIKEINRAEKSVLFSKDFSSSEVGTYKIKGMKYIINDTKEEQYLDFKDLEIKADFEVINKQNDSKVATVKSNVATISTDAEELSGGVENLLSKASVEPANNKDNIIVVIDPGHGGCR